MIDNPATQPSARGPTADPILADELGARSTRAIRAIFHALFVLLPVLVVATWVDSKPAEALATAGLLGAVFVLYLLLRTGRYSAMVHGLVIVLVLHGINGVLTHGSIRALGSLSFVAAVVIAGIFLSRNALVAAVAASAIALGALAWAQNAGWLVQPDYSVGVLHWLMHASVIATMGVIVHFARTLVLDALRRARSSEERFSGAFRLNPVGMAINRVSDGMYLDLSEVYPNALGYTREESVGRTATELGIWVSAADRAVFLERLMADRQVPGYATRMRTKAGRIIDCEVWAALVELGGEACILSTTLDVSAQRRHEAEIEALNSSLEARVAERTAQLAAANRELESFSYSVSHDLRAPLRAIDGFVRVLSGEHGAVDEGMRAKAQARVLAATARMNALIEDLIGLARVSRQALERGPVDLSSLARQIGDQQRERAPGRAVEFVVADDLSAQCDRALMRIVLDNLIGNAWKFTGRREDARIEFGREDLPGGEGAFYVRDNGAGFDPEYAHRLFAPFQRLHGDSEFEGTGIGLATVQRVVTRHGGRVWAMGEPDKGATFYFTCGAG